MLNVVGEYKYLGIWFTHDLSWSRHIEITLEKANKKTKKLQRLFNNRVPMRAKTLVWLAFVRPTLEYGCEAWDPNASRATELEPV